MSTLLRLLAVVIVVSTPSLSGQDVSGIWREVQEAFRSGDRFAIPALVADAAGDAETVARYMDIERALYWEGRDLPAAVFVAEQAIAYCLTRAALASSESPALAAQLTAAAGRIAYNLASSTWPGWDEADIEITSQQRELGWASARLALSVSEDLDAGPAALANGNWMVGAHQLAAGEFPDAVRSFERAALLARGVEDRGMELTSAGFAALAEIADDRSSDDALERLDDIRQQIERDVSDPVFWTGQLDTAARVFLGESLD